MKTLGSRSWYDDEICRSCVDDLGHDLALKAIPTFRRTRGPAVPAVANDEAATIPGKDVLSSDNALAGALHLCCTNLYLFPERILPSTTDAPFILGNIGLVVPIMADHHTFIKVSGTHNRSH